jgi:hypothetical protein
MISLDPKGHNAPSCLGLMVLAVALMGAGLFLFVVAWHVMHVAT